MNNKEDFLKSRAKLNQQQLDNGLSQQSIDNMNNAAYNKYYASLYKDDYQDFNDDPSDPENTPEVENPETGTLVARPMGNSTTDVVSNENDDSSTEKPSILDSMGSAVTGAARRVGGIGGSAVGIVGNLIKRPNSRNAVDNYEDFVE